MDFDVDYVSNSHVGIDNIGNKFADLITLSISENRDGEYGALAKSFGNIFGVCIERYSCSARILDTEESQSSNCIVM
jgi:hypothetical protein